MSAPTPSPSDRPDPDPESTAPARPGLERLRILLGFVRPHRRRLAGALVLGLAGTAMGLATPTADTLTP